MPILHVQRLEFLQDIYHKMIELSSEARRAYEVMVLNVEQSSSAEAEQEVTPGSEAPPLSSAAETSPEQSQPEQPDYCKCASSG